MSTPMPRMERVIDPDKASLGQLVGNATADLQRLVREEIALAKAELHQEASKAGRAAGMFGGAGFAGYMVAMTLTAAAIIAIAHVLDWGFAALIIAGLWGIAGGIMFLIGRRQMREFSPKPQRTVDRLREDVQWARHSLGQHSEH